MGLARRAAGLTPLLTFTSIPFRFTIRQQTRLITNTTVREDGGESQKGLTPQHQGPRWRVRIEPGRLQFEDELPRVPPGNEPLSSRDSAAGRSEAS